MSNKIIEEIRDLTERLPKKEVQKAYNFAVNYLIKTDPRLKKIKEIKETEDQKSSEDC